MSEVSKPRKRASQQEFKGEGFPPPLPKEVSGAAQKVADSLREKNKAAEKYNTLKDQCIEVMTRHNVQTVKIDEGGKMLNLTHDLKLKIVKVKETQSSDGE